MTRQHGFIGRKHFNHYILRYDKVIPPLQKLVVVFEKALAILMSLVDIASWIYRHGIEQASWIVIFMYGLLSTMTKWIAYITGHISVTVEDM
jgi:hypothetical protein